MLRILKNIFSKSKFTVDLHDKLENHFLECADQGNGVPSSSLKHSPIIGGGFNISKIYVIHNKRAIGWLERLDNYQKQNVLIVKHFGMDTAFTQNEYAIHMIKGFGKTVKKQFPHIDYLDFYELREPHLDQAVSQNYLKFFQKHKMTPLPGDIYRYKI